MANLRLLENVTEFIIALALLMTSFIRNLDGVIYVLIIIILIATSVFFIWTIFVNPQYDGEMVYTICKYGIIGADALNLLAAVFCPLILCYITYTFTMILKVVGLWLFKRMQSSGATPEGGKTIPEEMKDKREGPLT